jgi:glycosyltransferase involved in cell wall biosynthesis
MLTNLYPNPLQPHRANHNRQQFRLVAERVDASIIAPVAWTDELAERWRHRRLPAERVVRFDGIPVHHPRYWFTPKVLRGWYGRFYSWSVRDAFHHALADFQPELVYAPWAYPDGWAAVRLGHQAGLPVVLKVLGSDVLLLDQNPAKQRGTWEALRQADAVIAVSRDLADRLVQNGVEPEKVRLVYDGIDATKFHPGPRAEARLRIGIPGNEPLILFVGNLVAVKGLDVLIEACSRLADSGTAFTCVLIGEGPLRRQLERQVRCRGLQERVRFLGSVSNDLLPDWYLAAAAFVLPSRSEGVPNVLLEAAACGTPFVASRVGGIPEIADWGESRLVPPEEVDLLAEAIGTTLASNVDRAARSYAPIRTRGESADEIVSVFEQTLAARLSSLSTSRRQVHALASSNP